MDNRDLLLGELREFKSQTQSDLKEIKEDIRSLNIFKWKIAGISGFMAFMATLIVEFIRFHS